MKTDNHNLDAKLKLRRLFLKGGERVLDCFSGESESIWRTLRREYEFSEYLALDVKRKRNRLKIDSLRFLQGQKWGQDVVDLDAYGAPWAHWGEVIKSDRHSQLVVFLTIGTASYGLLSNFAKKSLGIPPETPRGMERELGEISVSFCLAECCKHGWIVDEAIEAVNPGGNARYIGVKIKRK